MPHLNGHLLFLVFFNAILLPIQWSSFQSSPFTPFIPFLLDRDPFVGITLSDALNARGCARSSHKGMTESYQSHKNDEQV